ncbi:MAG: hypothetical protein ACC608_06030 [Anaerofustis sp.]
MNNRSNENHLSETTMLQFAQGKLFGDELIDAVEHLGSCELCCASFAQTYPDECLSEPPQALASAIKLQIRSERTARSHFLYNLKIGFALTCSLAMLFAVPFSGLGKWNCSFGAKTNSPFKGWFETVQTKFSDFSDTITQGGFFSDETTTR